MPPLTKSEIRKAIHRVTQTGEMVDPHDIAKRLCRRDATGRISGTDYDLVDAVILEMAAGGYIKQNGPFIFDPAQRK